MSRPRTTRCRARPPWMARLLVALVVVVTILPALPATAANDPARGRQWPLDVIGADRAHGTATGAGVVVAIVDSGVDLDHEDLAAKLVPGVDVVDGDGDPQDEFGHGTHVAGIVGAAADNGRGIVGAAPGAKIMPVRVLDEEGSGTSDDVTTGVRWAVDNGADVVNLSLGRTAQQVVGSGLTEAVRYAWERGVIVVVAAGNDFVLSSGFGDEPAVVVSATTRDDREPDYSSGVGSARWGMAAPGGGCELLTCPVEDSVFSTDWERGNPDVYRYRQGTSMAAPHVAGAAAMLLELGLSPRQVVDRLLSTAKDIGPRGRDSTFGAGRLDLAAAVAGLGAPSEGTGGDDGADGATGGGSRSDTDGGTDGDGTEAKAPQGDQAGGESGSSDGGTATTSPPPSGPSTAPPGTSPTPSTSTPSAPATPLTDPTPSTPSTPSTPPSPVPSGAAGSPAASPPTAAAAGDEPSGDDDTGPVGAALVLLLAAGGALAGAVHGRRH